MVVLRVIDFECSDLEPPAAEVIEVGLCDLVKAEGQPWTVMRPIDWLCGTEKPLAPGARSAHHLSKADLEGWDAFDAPSLWERAKAEGASVVAAHNAEYEARFWGEPTLPVICTYKAALRIWPDAPSHSNGVLRYWLEDQGLITLDHVTAMPPHRAGPDAYVTAHILKALFAAGATGRDMVAWTQLPKLMPRITFGKHKGAEWSDAPEDYLAWVVNKSDLDADTKWNASQELQRRRPS